MSSAATFNVSKFGIETCGVVSQNVRVDADVPRDCKRYRLNRSLAGIIRGISYQDAVLTSRAITIAHPRMILWQQIFNQGWCWQPVELP